MKPYSSPEQIRREDIRGSVAADVYLPQRHIGSFDLCLFPFIRLIEDLSQGFFTLNEWGLWCIYKENQCI